MNFRKKSDSRSGRAGALATVSGLALSLALSPAAFAQDVSEDQEFPAGTPESVEDDDNVIIVTGFRASLNTAQDVKRDADTVVDVISAEDIGALPDRSVAEALQRVPGVNISRFEQRDDPDRFSVEGSGVIIRGLAFVRSELNGRDIFSANGGRSLSFNDVSPELLGRVEVYKNTTADMIDGGISGTVNLVTRKPLDTDGFKIAGTFEYNVGDLAEEWSPGFSTLLSYSGETPVGRFGVQIGYAQQELVTRTDASQLTDPCYRDASLTAGCLRVVNVGSGGYSGNPNFNASNFPPANSVIVPKGGGVRTTNLERDRKAFSGVLQWESTDGAALVTIEYLQAEVDGKLNEFAALALVNDEVFFAVPAAGSNLTFDSNGVFQTGTLTNNIGPGIPIEFLRFQREDQARTDDISIDVDLAVTDRLRFNFEAQHISSDRQENGVIAVTKSFGDVRIDNTGDTPQIEFLPSSSVGTPNYFNDPARTLYWFLIDNQVRNEGSLTSLRFDAEYDVSDEGFFRKARFGARWGDRNRVTRSQNFANWGNLSAEWGRRNGNWNCGDPQAFGCGGAYIFDFPGSANLYNPFGDNFQRGAAPVPYGDGSAYFFGGDNLIEEYFNGTVEGRANAISTFAPAVDSNIWGPVYNRQGLVPGTSYLPGEISDVDENTTALYARMDFGHYFNNGWELTGNIGVRYVQTDIDSEGEITFPTIDPNVDANSDGQYTAAELQAYCVPFANQPNNPAVPGFCSLPANRLQEYAAVFTGENLNDDETIEFSNWLPSFNAKLDIGNGILFRVAVSKGISRPDLSSFRTGGSISDNTVDLAQAGGLADGPLFQIFTGNRLLRPVEAWNYDFSAEWYFADVGSLTMALFQKDFSNLFGFGPSVRTFTSPSGATTEVEVNGPINFGEAKLRGVEVAYQHAWDFLPGPLSGLGTQLTYTYVDSKDFASSGDVFGDLPQPGISKHTVNAVLFYEKYGFSARAAYNWRSEFLQTPRDVIFPFSPIYGEATGQLDASIFYDVTDNIKVGVQGVNLLDEVTQTSSVIDFDGTRVIRSAYRNDRRFSFLVRFDF
ncbi:TonB-dependent receptor [Paraurantiacibacter namhicola]|uniref:TonB dependent receptor n=1 Tax=Paraurantiacibacter namhicola TaxID=645517 RepID=A0A1C7DBA5_9SPHN|nr:TonB-dependent receptor [Paraurantiacibacter namhicola]ANU08766.1 TonB dependent receptor [Paraurantiacibacter namhicola]